MNEPRRLAVVLVSGGMDSAVTAALAAQRFDLALLHATYGQRTAQRERQAFEALADYFGVQAAHRRILDLSFLAVLGGSALTDSSLVIPEGEPGGGIPVTYVPFRNALLISGAVAWAEVLGAETVFIGAVEEDSSGYPDCRESFLRAMEQAVRLGTRTGGAFRIEAPLLHRTKAEIVQEGLKLKVPFERTWSCYQGSNAACGRCESCRLRLKGFRGAGAVDPLPYQTGR